MTTNKTFPVQGTMAARLHQMEETASDEGEPGEAHPQPQGDQDLGARPREVSKIQYSKIMSQILKRCRWSRDQPHPPTHHLATTTM